MSSAAYCKVVFVIFLSQQSNFCRFRCVISTITKMLNFYGSFFYINICGFIGRGKFLYETRVLVSRYQRYKVQLPTSDSTEITAGGIKVTLEGPIPQDAP